MSYKSNCKVEHCHCHHSKDFSGICSSDMTFCIHCQPIQNNEEWEKEVLATYSPKLGVLQTGSLIGFIREQKQLSYTQGRLDMAREVEEEVIGEDERKVKLPVIQIQEQNNYDKGIRNEIRAEQRLILNDLKNKGGTE